MCFGGDSGPDAEQMYQERKVDYGELPSLEVKTGNKSNRSDPKYKNVKKPKKTGVETRSLINIQEEEL